VIRASLATLLLASGVAAMPPPPPGPTVPGEFFCQAHLLAQARVEAVTPGAHTAGQPPEVHLVVEEVLRGEAPASPWWVYWSAAAPGLGSREARDPEAGRAWAARPVAPPEPGSRWLVRLFADRHQNPRIGPRSRVPWTPAIQAEVEVRGCPTIETLQEAWGLR